MSKVLTKEIRAQIMQACIGATFKKRDEAMVKSLQKFARDLRQHEFGKEVRIMEKLPLHWQSRRGSIHIKSPYLPSQRNRSHSHGELGRSYEFGEQLIMPDKYVFADQYVDVSVDDSHPFCTRLTELQVEYKAIYEDTEKLRNQLASLLLSCRTLKTLHETWPEGKKFIPNEPVPVGAAIVPYKTKETINKMMGLTAA